MPFLSRLLLAIGYTLLAVNSSVFGQVQTAVSGADTSTALPVLVQGYDSQNFVAYGQGYVHARCYQADTLAQSDTVTQSTRRLRTGLLIGSSALTLGSTYVYLEKKWWSEGYTSFHLDDGRDFRYASNVDKLGHLLGGIFTADVYYNGFRWAGVPQRRAEWYALGAAAFVQMSIEFKDGFSPRYGFSWADVTVGTLGGLWPMLQNRSAFFRDAQFKFSYWQRTTKYFDQRGIKRQPFSIDDYINQAYWFSFSPKHLFGPKTLQGWPDWLQISVGAGLDADTWSPTRTGEGGLWEVYLAPDIDLVKLFKPRKPLMRSILHVLTYIKVPTPTLQIAPRPKLWGLYF